MARLFSLKAGEKHAALALPWAGSDTDVPARPQGGLWQQDWGGRGSPSGTCTSTVCQGPWPRAVPTPGWVNWLMFPPVVGRMAAFSCYFQAGQRHPRGTGTGSLLDAKWGRRPSPSPRSLPSSGPLRVCNRRSCKQAGKRCQSSWETMPGLSGSSSPFQASQGR